MLSSLCLLPGLLLAVGLSTTVPASPTEVLAPQDKKQNKKQGRSNKLALHLIGRWLHTYRQGKWQLTGRTLGSRPLGGKSLLRDTGFVADKERQQQPAAGGRRRALRYRTARDELRILLDLAARMESVNAAKAVLEVAAVGLDRRIKYTSDMIPHTIRDMGARHLRRMSSGRVREYLVAAANGEGGGPEGIKVAMQAAALRLLGDIRDGSYRKVLEGQLTHPDAIVRTAVAESLAEIGEASTIEKLATALEKETAPSAIMAMMRAVAEVYQPSPKRVHMDHLRRAVIAAGKLLGCTDSWATDLRIVDFLAKFRYRDNVDRLIELLERYVKEPGRVKSGRLSLQLRKAANDTLTALTGAFHPMNQPEKWREFWEREKDNIKVDEIAKNAAAKISQKGHTVVKSDFFGIPVKGSRVVFVIDISGSMQWSLAGGRGARGTGGGQSGGGGTIKIDKAKSELLKAVNGLPPETQFNVIFYADDVTRWHRKLVLATARNKRALARRLEGENANGWTNMFDALKAGLELKSLVYGDHYDSSVDEIFILSDGVPTAGEVTDPADVVKQITETNKYSGVRINTIYLGGTEDGRGGMRGGGAVGARSGAWLMRELAERNGGRFVWPSRGG